MTYTVDTNTPEKSGFAVSWRQSCAMQAALATSEDEFIVCRDHGRHELQIFKPWGRLATVCKNIDPVDDTTISYTLTRNTLLELSSEFRGGITIEIESDGVCIREGRSVLRPPARLQSSRSIFRAASPNAPRYSAPAIRSALNAVIPYAKATRANDEPGFIFFGGDYIYAQKIRLGAIVAHLKGPALPTFALPVADARRLRRTLAHLSDAICIQIEDNKIRFQDSNTMIELGLTDCAARPTPNGLLKSLPSQWLHVDPKRIQDAQMLNSILVRPNRRDDLVAFTLTFETSTSTLNFRGFNRMVAEFTSKGSINAAGAVEPFKLTIDLEGFLAFDVDNTGAPIDVGYIPDAKLLCIGQKRQNVKVHAFLIPIDNR